MLITRLEHQLRKAKAMGDLVAIIWLTARLAQARR